MKAPFDQQNCYVIRYADRFLTSVYHSGYHGNPRSISNIIPRIINHNKTFISARKRAIAQLRASQRGRKFRGQYT